MTLKLARSHTPELLDQLHDIDPALLCGNLSDIARYNRWLGANRLMHRLASHMMGAPGLGLDVGAGAGDFVAYTSHHGKGRWVALDASAAVLQCGAVAASGLAIPFPDCTFDVVTCAQTLHHLELAAASTLLRECARVARNGVIVVDLARSVATLAGVWLLTRLTTRNAMTRADGVLSARRAYTAEEARDLARDAGWPAPHTHVQMQGPVRWSIQLRKRD